MARSAAVAALEAQTPWTRASFRRGLASLTTSTAAASRRFAADTRTLARLAGQVPRCAGDESGGTPWTSFRREVAVARSVSDQAAGSEIRTALRLSSVLPCTLELLRTGALTVNRARTFVDELEPYDDTLAGQLDRDLATDIAQLAPWRIKQAVRKAALTLDPDAAAVRTARKNAGRNLTFSALDDGQACVVLTGPATPLTRWHATLDARARALRTAGDARNLDALRFDLAVNTYPCTTHPPATPEPVTAHPNSSTDTGHRGPEHGSTGHRGPEHGSTGHRSAEHSTADPSTADPHSADPSTTDPSSADPSSAGPSGAGPDTTEPSATDASACDRASRAHAQATLATALAAEDGAPAGLRLSGVEAAPDDCRMSRPVQAMIVVPVETALGLSNEPAWLDGYGWIDAPTSRTLLIDAELRQVCADRSTGQLLDLSTRDTRPPPTPDGLRTALLDLLRGDLQLSDLPWRTEPEHDPSPPLRTFTTLRDRTCDGPTQTATPASRCDQDHDQPHPTGPTAAWNLAARSRRTHALKHYGWTPIRTTTSTIWTSPAGQTIQVPRPHTPPPGIDTDPHTTPAGLPDATALADLDTYQLTPPTHDDTPPWIPDQERPGPTTWSVIDGSDEPPF